MFEHIQEFENQLSKYTGAPYVVTTDCCTHAIELCLIWLKRHSSMPTIGLPAHSYISVPMTLHKLGIDYSYSEYDWVGSYDLQGTRVVDAARLLAPNMYQAEKMMCLSFGFDKPLNIGRGGAILLDNKQAYDWLIRARWDGRDLGISPWQDQVNFEVGYHYRMIPEEAIKGLELLPKVDPVPKKKNYPDLRKIKINDISSY